jgi:hypothetical protein
LSFPFFVLCSLKRIFEHVIPLIAALSTRKSRSKSDYTTFADAP